jgi:hypothetical protein
MALFTRYRNLIPLLILAALCLYTLLKITIEWIFATAEHRIFTLQHYLAFAAVGLNLLIYFYYRRAFKYTLTGMLFLSLFSIVNYTPDEYSITFGLSDLLQIKLQPISLLFIGIYYYLNRLTIRRLMRTYLMQEPHSKKQQTHYQEQVMQFKVSFAKKSNEHLLAMAQKQELVPGALEAVQQLLAERGVTHLR